MEWAVERDAEVINLSLDSGTPDGTDPISQSVNALTERAGALFVVAAGNEARPGEGPSPPRPPPSRAHRGRGRQERRARRVLQPGPRVGDSRVKPEIIAPGVDITAARAEGAKIGDPVGEASLTSGTSMAAPHVAGAAAVLARSTPTGAASSRPPGRRGQRRRADPYANGAAA